MEVKRIVLGIDGSRAAGAAARWAAEAVAGSDGEVIAVHGLGSLTELLLALPPSRISDWKKDLRRAMDQNWCQPLREVGVRYRCVLADMDPAHAVLETARREDADLIVVGTEGESNFFRRLFGNLSSQVVHHARRPIVVVPFAPATPAKKTSEGGAPQRSRTVPPAVEESVHQGQAASETSPRRAVRHAS